MRPLIVIALLFFLASCQKTKKVSYSIDYNTEKVHPGKIIIETQCNICHSPTASHEQRLAPPLIAVKKHYISEETTQKEFSEDLQIWFDNPTEDNARMYGAVRRFGVMPKLILSNEDLEKVSDYIYNYDIEQPEWFEDHYNEEKRKGFPMRNRNRI
ncbi:hypothetical protein [Seonamhaeicola maritimus]|uniref:Cytochrome c domain-containing protein n=1 Tax=Seonamhaeicola maritimus TaxID=2591822 RepID=A0A5C7GEG8_9FLAO|nr:hypothetical protein [Seonamhaeicola maritimus]TXG35127.1 hypothetical protein FUA22_15335 [Seonamhaeicola maritimus]